MRGSILFLLIALLPPLPCSAVSPPELFEEEPALPALGPVGVDAVPGSVDVRPGSIPGKRDWGPEQLVGEPDTPGSGDIVTAWASASQDERDEWIEVEYAVPVTVRRVLIHETYNPGAVTAVKAFTETGMEVELWSGKDPVARGEPRGIAEIHPNVKFTTHRLRIEIKSTEVPGWNEIDTVGAVDYEGKTHWPVRARASTTYASGEPPRDFLIPNDEADVVDEDPPKPEEPPTLFPELGIYRLRLRTRSN